ncbi:MAG: phosphatidylserine decarboxylase, partial [Acidobacteriota bacterium]
GSLDQSSMLWIKDKLFSLPELLDTDADHESSHGSPPRAWSHELTGGDFAVFRLTPEKYHYNHTPVAGRVVDFYDITGTYHSCHPDAVIELVTPFSKNRRVVTIVDTDVPGGTGVGLVAMVEVVALMIGEVVQRYSSRAYESPQPMAIGCFLERGQPKSLFRPGSSTVVLVFQRGRVSFLNHLIENQVRPDVASRLTIGFRHPLAETDVQVRSAIGRARAGGS